MALAHHVVDRIKRATLSLYLQRRFSDPSYTYDQAQADATKLIAREHKRSPRPNKPWVPPQRSGDEITLTNAVPLLIAKVMTMAQRALAEPLPKPKRAPRVPFLKKENIKNNVFSAP